MISRALFLLLAAGMVSGCATQKMSGDQLARVAKDWSLSIRASQVIPVYPLTEDLQPGDVFLVQTPVEEQVKVYLAKGFLPLENLVTRLSPSGYARVLSWLAARSGWRQCAAASLAISGTGCLGFEFFRRSDRGIPDV